LWSKMAHSGITAGARGRLVAVIGDEDTCTGFLLGGIGEINAKRQKNFLVVTKGERWLFESRALLGRKCEEENHSKLLEKRQTLIEKRSLG